jgi:phage terminase small subunit
MARAPNVKVDKAYELFKQGYKLIDISKELDIPEGTIRSWKNRYKWGSATLQKDKCNVAKKRGGQPGNKNSIGKGAPEKNKNAEKHGFLAKWLPKETAEIMNSIEQINPLDILWNNIQLQYTAIIRAQNLMYVKDQADKTTTQIARSDGDTSNSEKWEVQQAWDKQATFLQAQSRAMTTLNSMVKRYDDMLHKNWDLATEEQKARIEVLKSRVTKDEDTEVEDDGFIEALEGKIDGIWEE